MCDCHAECVRLDRSGSVFRVEFVQNLMFTLETLALTVLNI